MDTSSEGSSQTLTIPNLSSQTQLGYNLTVGIQSSSQTGSEGEVTVTTKQTASSSHSSDSPETTGSQCVLQALTLVGDGGLEQAGWQEPAACLGIAGSGGGRSGGRRGGRRLRRESSGEGDWSWSWSSL